jgi:hypothetical protein
MKECPFCDASGDNVQIMGSDDWFWVGCLQCQCAGPSSDTEDKAVGLWEARGYYE